MPDLASLQKHIHDVILSGKPDEAAWLDAIKGGPVAPAQALNIHINNFRETLAEAVANSFPVLEAFVGRAFLQAMAARYVVEQPPRDAPLQTLMAGFADFIRAFPHATDWPYLGDLAALEWLVGDVQNRVPEPVLAPQAVPARLKAGRFRLACQASLMKSHYPLVSFWMVGQGQIPAGAVDRHGPAESVLVAQIEGSVQILPLDRDKVRLLAGEGVNDDTLKSLLHDVVNWPVFAADVTA